MGSKYSSVASRPQSLSTREGVMRDDGSCVVGRASELAEGERWLVKVGMRTIGVFRVQGAFYAVLNRCPHQGAELCRGDVFANVTSDTPDTYHYESERLVLSCPWHGWEFDIATGESVFDPTGTRVKCYEIGLDEPRAETFPTDVQEGWLVVQIR